MQRGFSGCQGAFWLSVEDQSQACPRCESFATLSFDRFGRETYHLTFMLRRLPEFIEPLRLAGLGRSLQGRLPLERFRRLAESLHSSEGEADVDLEFGVDEQGRPRILGRVGARLEVICQRCLAPMVLETDLVVRLYLAAAEAPELDVPDGFDTLSVSDRPMLLADIVEDELILGLPLVAMHSRDECTARTEYSVGADKHAEKGENPFAVLAALKKDERC